MSAVRISVAASARRGRIAFFMGIFTPAVGGAGSCARMNRPGEPFAALSGRPAVGRGCPHHLLCLSLFTCDLSLPTALPFQRPGHGRARTDPGKAEAHARCREGNGREVSVGRSSYPNEGSEHPATEAGVTAGHVGGCVA